ncbi:MAG: hypothetical protein KatS3mg031_0638 [Chitinophagales bacterium]|nr:MAG: hypothetical protein KatS3mg031_0638 [Chitinophagales bacterium]
MNTLKNQLDTVSKWQPYAYSFIRIYLGVALFARGAYLIMHPEAIYRLDTIAEMHMYYSYITIMHVLGGFMLALGFFARLSAFLQLPILLSAVFLIHIHEGLMMGGQSLELAALVLFLLIIFLIFGPGPLAVNKY